MTSDHPSPEVWSEDADDEVEKLYATLGKYLMSFQWLEGSLDSTLLLAWGQENWSRSHQRLARMTMEKKTDAVEREVLDGEAFSRARTRPDWIEHFRRVIERLHVERRRRNALLHSQFLFDFLKIGQPPLASSRIRGNGQIEFSQQNLDREFQKALLNDLSQLAFDLNFVKVQLLHDYIASNPQPFSPQARP